MDERTPAGDTPAPADWSERFDQCAAAAEDWGWTVSGSQFRTLADMLPAMPPGLVESIHRILNGEASR